MRKLISWVFPLLILLIVLFLVYKNYIVGTMLLGWDSLLPEFDFKLNIFRSLTAAWQEYQGLGVPGGMGHAAEITRQLILWIISPFIPTALIRYVWLFIMLALGPLGVYFLLSKVIFKNQDSLGNKLASFLSALFYVFNLATLQYFFVPYETFLSFFGFLPWLIFGALRYLKSGSRKDLLIYSLISLIATSAFYVQTMFVVYMVILSFFLCESFIQGWKGVKKSLLIVVITLIINSFWFLPTLYSTVSNSDALVNSRINSIATPETQLQNIARGKFSDIATLKGFWWDYYDLLSSEKYDYLFRPWINYYQNHPEVNNIGIAIFITALVGYLFSLIQKDRFNWRYFGIPLFATVYFMLATTNKPFGGVFSLVFTKLPILSEIFRSVFTKWSLVMGFVYSIGAGFFLYTILQVTKKIKFLFVIPLAFFIAATFSVLYMTRPFFEGELISNRMQVKFPSEYTELFTFMRNQDPAGRLAYFPVHTFWGWEFNSWGYDGSGYLWYGIPQAFLSRTFDVWSRYNQTFYDEAYKAVYEDNVTKFENVLEKYQVGYMLVDGSVINPGGGGEKALLTQKAQNLLARLPSITKVTNIGFLTLYQREVPAIKFISAPTIVNEVSNVAYSAEDSIYGSLGNYYQGVGQESISFPYANLEEIINTHTTVDGEFVTITSDPIPYYQDKIINYPEFATSEAEFKEVFNQNWLSFDDRGRLVARIPITEWVKEDFTTNRGYSEAKNCDINNKGFVTKSYLPSGGLKLNAKDAGIACDYIYFPTVRNDVGYLININGRNIDGEGAKLYLLNIATNRLELEELMPAKAPYNRNAEEVGYTKRFLLYPKTSIEDKGYTITIESRSYKNLSVENVVTDVNFIKLPIGWLKHIKVGKNNDLPQRNNLIVKSVNKYGTWGYKVEVEGSGLLELGQGYEDGWLGLGSDRTKLKHVKVNSWANGWIIPGSSTVYIFFWPQLLEWGGLLVVGATLLLISMKKR